MTNILVVDDKASMRLLLEEYLSEQGFAVQAAANGREALYTARRFSPDLILLDIMMPQMDGYEFLRQYRREKKTPVIILTALEDEKDAVLGLDLGADDYVIKPFRMRELVSRIRAVLRRAESSEPGARLLRAGEISLDETSHQVLLRGQPAHLTPTEFEMLRLLMTSPERVFTRDQLVDHLAQHGFGGLSSTLNVHVRNLRTKIEHDPDQPQHILTVFGVGYKFSGPVK